MSWLPKFFHKRVAINSGLAQYHAAVFYPVGAENQVYEPGYPVVAAMLPPVGLIGNCVFAGAAPCPTQLPQLYAAKTAFVAGIGGPTAGQIIGAPLNIPDTTNGSQ
jgi:hypothetical protein